MIKALITAFAALIQLYAVRYERQRAEEVGRTAAYAEAMKDVAATISDIAIAERDIVERLHTDRDGVLSVSKYNRANWTKPDGGGKE